MREKRSCLERRARGGIPPEMKAMAGKVLITGSNGMLGTDLCSELSADYAVYGADLAVNCQLPVAGKKIICDITDGADVADAFGKLRPRFVIHTAAWADVDGCELDGGKAYAVNSAGTQNVALASEEAGATLIYISTDFVFDGRKKSPYIETDKPGPLNIYARSKLSGEESVKKIMTNYFTLRTSWLYGKNGKNFVDTIIDKAKAARELKVVDDQAGSPTYTKDFAKAIHTLLDKITMDHQPSTINYGLYHVSNSGGVSWYEYAKEILKLSGLDTKISPISSEELGRPAKRPAMSVLDNSKFNIFTGHKMRPWKDALKEYLKERPAALINS
ncbi:MAG: dTDP-4-dehydrorhamnose reductase [Candidatus Omnitrophota bacterium]